MRTPSLERRTVLTGVLTVAIVVVTLDVLVYAALARTLDATVAEALWLRSGVTRDLARRYPDVDGLAGALSELGVPATVTGEDGSSSSAPAVIRNRPGEELVLGTDPDDLTSRTVVIGDGRQVEVFVSRAGVSATLERLLVIELIASLFALGAASLLLRRGASVALTPLDEVVEAAQRTTAGHTGQRLEADDPTSELGRLAVAFDQMLDELESALQESREAEERGRRFLADAAHQLRTPLASIRAGVELLIIDPDPRKRDDHLAHLLRETSRGTRVLNALLTLARLDRGRSPEPTEVDLMALCADEVERAASLSPHLRIDADLGSETLTAHVDDPSLRDAIANLLDNARRHATSQVHVRLRADDDRASIEVRDDGPGVPIEAHDLIFERFATLDGLGGTGLGLPIARAVARQHGGDLVLTDDVFVLSVARGPVSQPAA